MPNDSLPNPPAPQFAKKTILAKIRQLLSLQEHTHDYRMEMIAAMVAEIESCGVALDEETKAKVTEIDRKRRLGEPPDTRDFLAIQFRLIDQLKSTSLDRGLDIAYQNLKNVAGPVYSADWEERHRKFGSSGDVDEKRQLLKSLIKDAFTTGLATRTLEAIKFDMYIQVGAPATLYICFFVIAAWHYHGKLITTMPLMGALGASVSVMQRIYTASFPNQNVKGLLELVYGVPGLIVSVLLGSFFPLIAALLMIAGYLQGGLFAELNGVEQIRMTYGVYKDDFLKWPHHIHVDVTPALGTNNIATGFENRRLDLVGNAESVNKMSTLAFQRNYAKLLFLAFLCGFAERLIPDTLSSLVSRASKSENNTRL